MSVCLFVVEVIFMTTAVDKCAFDRSSSFTLLWWCIHLLIMFLLYCVCLSHILMPYFILHSEYDCLEEVTTICAMLSAENIWITPPPPGKAERFAGGSGSGGGKYGGGAPPNATGGESRITMNFKGGYGSYGSNNNSNNRGFSSEDSENARRAHAALSHPFGDFQSYLRVFDEWERSGQNFKWCERNFINARSIKTVSSIR